MAQTPFLCLVGKLATVGPSCLSKNSLKGNFLLSSIAICVRLMFVLVYRVCEKELLNYTFTSCS